MRSGQDALLAESTQHLFEALLQRIGEAMPWRGGAAVPGEHAIGHVVSRAPLAKMPTRVT